MTAAYDFAALTNVELDELRVQVLTEQEKRANLAAVPAEIQAAASRWRAAGLDPADLLDALTENPSVEVDGNATPIL
ncbi:hypothetical protein [Kocuria sp.]|uniref:hypothetical protein n=1 Tax=Kocuria sp. TaxID=1871328 RepID=UPI0026E06CB6|nr:hypothetical protein [Kocuria sp.]MDO5619262.1 hypothetical protein [Kocuria sp.]